MCVVYRNGALLTRGIAGGEKKRYKITRPRNLWKILELTPL